jgi:hypothetical protein
MSFRYYLKKLTSNELGYRKGRLSTGQMLYVSKQAADFFPPLSAEVNNDSVLLEFIVDYRDHPVFLNLVYHNDKYNRQDGTRDEYRIYLNRDIAPDDFFFRPDDIVLMERLGDRRYSLRRYRTGNAHFVALDSIIAESSMRGRHALVDNLPPSE